MNNELLRIIRRLGTMALLAVVGMTVGCAKQDDSSKPLPRPTANSPLPDNLYRAYYTSGEIKFLDDVASNVPVQPELVEISFQDLQGVDHPVKEYAQDQNLVVVVTRGHTNPVCPFCTTQTARLIKQYPELQKRNAQVIVIYPVENLAGRSALDEFLKTTRSKLEQRDQPVPFPILFDIELKGVDRLGIRKDLAKPATYIVDRRGKVRFAYVGEHLADRPSVEAVLKELDKVQAETGAAQSDKSVSQQ
jgi:peroxiredoxin